MPTRTRAKICGITRVDDALCAVQAGADAIGLVFYEPSPRHVSVARAVEISRAVGPFVSIVGLFVDAPRQFIESVLEEVPLSLLQFHGGEPRADCEGFGIPYIKAIRMSQQQDVIQAAQHYHSAQGILVDAYQKGVPGGTGKTFDWARLPREITFPLILAGGLNPVNVRKAIHAVHPYAVDVSGGVECEKGIKDHEAIARFINEVTRGSENE